MLPLSKHLKQIPIVLPKGDHQPRSRNSGAGTVKSIQEKKVQQYKKQDEMINAQTRQKALELKLLNKYVEPAKQKKKA